MNGTARSEPNVPGATGSVADAADGGDQDDERAHRPPVGAGVTAASSVPAIFNPGAERCYDRASMKPFPRERDVAVAAAREAGAAIRRYYEGTVEAREKGHDNPVTAADLEANEIIHRHVSTAFPDDGWLSEETADSTDRLAKRRVWIVDPLDGTKEFIQHIPEFCVCIALVEHGRPVVAVEYNPAADRLYTRQPGRRARR